VIILKEIFVWNYDDANIYSENNLMSLNAGLLGERERNIRKLFL
jgi:hypothetical protein